MKKLTLQEQLAKATDPALRAKLRRQAHAEKKGEGKKAEWDDQATYEVKSLWKEPVSVSYLSVNPKEGYLTETLYPNQVLILKGYQVRDQLKGLSLQKKSRGGKAVIEIKQVLHLAPATPSSASASSSPHVLVGGSKPKKKSKDASSLTEDELKALVEGTELPG